LKTSALQYIVKSIDYRDTPEPHIIYSSGGNRNFPELGIKWPKPEFLEARNFPWTTCYSMRGRSKCTTAKALGAHK